MKTSKTHTHVYADHPNPSWGTHVACLSCGFAIHRSSLSAAILAGGRYLSTCVSPTQRRALVGLYEAALYYRQLDRGVAQPAALRRTEVEGDFLWHHLLPLDPSYVRPDRLPKSDGR
jgi:hypothetical protein